MRRANRFFTVQTFLLINIYCVVLGFGQRDKFLGGFIDFLNNLPNQPYIYEDGLLLSRHDAGPNQYKLEVSLKASEVVDPKSLKLLRCTATVQDGEAGVTVLDGAHQCHEDVTRPAQEQPQATPAADEVDDGGTDAPLQELPVKLDNEVQADTAATSGEQFVAIPRHVPDSPCIGCSSRVNPKAPGVHELALLGVRHLDRHDPDVTHSLEGVLEVERQVQIVNGVRYILTIKINYDNCTIPKTDGCSDDRICKISILEKPWVKLPDGSKFRAILANNCTENWLFGDDGEVLPPEKSNINSISDDEKHGHESDNDIVKAVYQTDTQSKPATERTLSEHDVKLLEDQIIPLDQHNTDGVPSIKITSEPHTLQHERNMIVAQKSTVTDNTHKEGPEEQTKEYVDDSLSTLSTEKKKDIDELLGFLNYANLDPKQEEQTHATRMRRSFDRDLKLLDLAEAYKKIKIQVAAGRNVFSLGEFLVNYLNEMDIEMKTHTLQDILSAEEESDNDRQFVYIQVRVYIPCGKMECDSNENVTNICNAVIDNTEFRSPQMLNSFCYEEKINKQSQGKVTTIALNDPVLQNQVIDVLKKIEDESDFPNALNLRVLGAGIRKTVGIITEVSIEIVYTNCNKTIPLSMRNNCSALENVGSNICEVVVVDRSWLNDRQISYTCTKRSVDESMSTASSKTLAGNMRNPKILSMAQLALRHLEEQSNIDHRQKVVDIRKVSTQLVAGLLTNLDLVVGYTTCLHSDPEVHLENCKLYDGLPLRKCKAQIWDRSWLIDGKQVKVTCEDTPKLTLDLDNKISRKKRDLEDVMDQNSNKEFTRQTPGGVVEQDINNPKYLILAKKSLKTIVNEIKLSGAWKVDKLNKVTTQIVEGTLTVIDFTITNNEGLSLPCHSKIWARPWLKKKEFKVACKKLTTSPKSFGLSQKEDSNSNKYQVLADASLKNLGGVEVKDPNDPKYQILAEDSLQKYVTERKLSGVWKVAKVSNVTSQLVSGTITSIEFTISNNKGVSLPCRSRIWEQPWLNKKDIKVNCKLIREMDVVHKDPNFSYNLATEALQNYLTQSNLRDQYAVHKVNKIWNVSGHLVLIDFSITNNNGAITDCHAKTRLRSWSTKKHFRVYCLPVKSTHDMVTGTENIDGGIAEKDPKDPKYRKLAEDSLQKYMAQTKLTGVWKVATISKVTYQVVEGSLTRIDFTISNRKSVSLPCHSEIWERPWLNKKDIKVVCQMLKKTNLLRQVEKPAMVIGDEQEENPDNEKFAIEASKYFKQCCSESRRLGGTFVLNGSDHSYIKLAEKSLEYYYEQVPNLMKEGKWKPTNITLVLNTIDPVKWLSGSMIELHFKANNTGNNYGKILSCVAKTWNMPWLKRNDTIGVDCGLDARRKFDEQSSAEYQVRGLKEQDPYNPKYVNLAKEALDKYLQLSGSTGELTKITYVSTQVLNGLKTVMYFQIIQNNSKNLICKAKVVEQAWLNNKKIEVNCDETDQEFEKRRGSVPVFGDSKHFREKRQIFVGGQTEKDPSEPKYHALAEKALLKHVSQTGLTGVWKVAEVTKVTYQIVSGSLARIDFTVESNDRQILSCHSKIWEQPWLSKEEITVDCTKPERQKRTLDGGIEEKDPKDPNYLVLAEKSLQQHVSQKGLAGVWKVAEVTKVTHQVVSGSLIQIDFVVVENGGYVLSCHSEVLQQPWLNKEEITVDCNKIGRQKGVDSIEVKNPNDPKYQVLAEKSLNKYLSEKGLAGYVDKVNNVTEQVIEGYTVVAGSLIVIDFTGVEANGQHLSCHSIVWDRPWLSNNEITTDCKKVSRLKRQVPGGIQEEDPSTPEYQVLAEKSLQKHISQKGLTGVWKVVEVTKATYQVVSGSLKRIDFTIVEHSGQQLSCHSEVWEQPWLNKEEITVDCDNAGRRKRQVPGGIQEKDPKSPEYRVLAEKSLQTHISQKGLTGVWKVVEVTKVTYQVVSGSLKQIDFTVVEQSGQQLSCHSKVWEQPWLNKEEITVDCTETGRQKRTLDGGIEEKDPNDPEYQVLAEKSLQKHISQKGLTGVWKVVEVTKATYQVVSGSLKRIDFTIVEQSGQQLSCHSEVWEQPWLNKEEITVDCDNAGRRKRQVPGGIQEKDPKSPEYRVLADKSLQKHISQKGLTGVWKVVEVTKATYQVVSGSLKRIDFTIVEQSGQQLSCHSEVWEQPWLNKEEITVDCDNAGRRKRQVPGGIQEKDPKSPEYRVLADKSLQKHISQKGLTGVWKVLEVTKATYQVVSGSLKRIDFTIVEQSGQQLSCHSEVWEQPWLNKEEITVDCDNAGRRKRQVPGGIQEKDPKSPEYRVLADKSLQKHISQKGLTGVWKVVEVTKATYQVVSGSLKRIDFTIVEQSGQQLSCHSEVWEQPWLNKEEITVDCDNAGRRKRQVPGGIQEKDPKSPEYRVLADKSLQKHISQKGLTGVWKVVEVTKATYQVVSGSLKQIDFTVVEQSGQQLFCHSRVWEQPWLNKEEITVDCTEKGRQKRTLDGGIEEKDPNDPEYQILAEKSLQKHISQKGLTGEWKVVEVTKATYQVVSGSLKRIDFTIVELSGQQLSCHSKVWEQPWLNKEEITVDCREAGRQKRTLDGGIEEKDPNDPEYQVLAEKSLQKHISQKGLTGVWKVVEVTKATYQVVSGSLKRIDFTVVERSGQQLSCHSEVWEQPWLNKEEITVDCREAGRQKRTLDGGIEEKDPNDPEYQVLAEKSLQKHISQKGLTGVWKVVEVTKATYQVVSGSLKRIDFTIVEHSGQQLSCYSEVWEQPWLNKEEITVDCDNAGRRKRQVPGGIQEKDPKSPEYRVLAEKSLQKHVSQKGLTGVWKVVEVTKVTYQVVSGSLKRIDFTVVEHSGQQLSCHSEVWEQPWLNKEEITVDCDNAGRRKRQVPGGIQEKDPKSPEYRVLADKSLQKHISQKGLTGVWKVLEVTKATYQVVSGSLKRIDFTIVEQSGQQLSCHSEVWEQPWLNKEEITVDCDNAGRRKRQVPGGIQEKDPKSPEYRVLADKSLQKHISQKGLTGVWKVVEVTKATYQVVSGSLKRIDFTIVEHSGQQLSCYSEVWEQPWLNKEEITVDCDNAGRRKRQVPGGIQEKDPKSPEYRVLAEKSLQKHVSQKGLTGVWKVVEVTKVTYQVVSGSLKRIDFTVVEHSGQQLSCHSEVWEQPWLNKEEITVDCREAGRQKRTLDGGIEEKDPKDPEYQVMAEKSLQKHISQKGLTGVWKVAEVSKVTYQVVSGSLTNIEFAGVENSGQVLSCHSKIWGPRLNKEEISVECKAVVSEKQDIKEIEYRQLAKEALSKYDKDSDSKYSNKVLKVRHVYRYNVSEHVTVIDFIMVKTKCLRVDEGSIEHNCEVDTSVKPIDCRAVVEKENDNRQQSTYTECMIKKDTEVQKLKHVFKEWLSKDERIKKSADKPNVVAPPTTSDARFKRQIRPDDYEIDDDVKFHYAQKAIDDLNLRSDTHNMQKLVAIHSTATSMQMGTQLVRMYIEVSYTYCLKQNKPTDMSYCDELDGLNHRLCLVKVYPTPEDDTVINHVTTICDDEEDFESSSGINVLELIKASINYIEQKEKLHYKLVHQGEPNVVPSLDTSEPIKLSFIVVTTNCSKSDVKDIYDYARLKLRQNDCVVLESVHPKACSSFIWMSEKTIKHIKSACRPIEPAARSKRSTDSASEKNTTSATVEELVNESIHKLEMSNIYKYKQRILQINSFNTKITTGKLTTIDFDVGYTSCLKFEWVDDISKCEFLEHLPRRHCVSMVYERLWVSNGRKIHVKCEDDETPLEVHTEFENAHLTNSLAAEALKHIEFKYPHTQRQKVVRVFSMDKQNVAGLHYRLKLEVGFTDCAALSVSMDCNLAPEMGDNKFCRANIWVRPWTDHPPTVRVVCDYQEAATSEIYHQVQAEHLFYAFITTHRPRYLDDPVEMAERFKVFKANVRRIHELNTREKGTARYAVTQFADLTYEEFFRQYLGLKPGLRDGNQVPRAPAPIPSHEIPSSFDWRDQGAVTPVKNQGSCGSCWAFSVTGNIEGQYKLHTGKLLSLSEQELVDCDKLDQGCSGGLPDNAYRAIEAMGGLETEDDYPYEGENDKCTFNKTMAKVQLSGAVNISSNETDMAKWLVQNGPISIGINANAMQFYVGGISHPWRMLCNPNNIDHGVLIVGYGVKNYPLFNKVLPYWIVKNSWGASWGEQGYYRVYRGDGTCGVNTLASSAILALPNEY